MDLTAFKTQFPEFQSAGDTLLDTFLAAAADMLDPDYWGSDYDQGHGYLTAALLAESPSGMNARLVADKGESTYAVTFRELRTKTTFADRVF